MAMLLEQSFVLESELAASEIDNLAEIKTFWSLKEDPEERVSLVKLNPSLDSKTAMFSAVSTPLIRTAFCIQSSSENRPL